MSDREQDTIEQPVFSMMDVGDWREYLRQHRDRCLVINGPEGVHTLQYEEYEGQVMFFAHGSQGYDEDGTRAVLEDIAEVTDSNGLRVQTKDETFGGEDDAE